MRRHPARRRCGRTSTPIACSRCASASPTPPLSGMMTTRLPGPSVTPVGLQMVERRPQDGHRHAARNAVGGIETRKDWARTRRSSWRRAGGRRSVRCWAVTAALRAGAAAAARLVARELDHVRQGREVAQLQILVARNVVGCAHRGKHLRLLDGVDAEVGFQIEIEVQHVRADSPSSRPQSPASSL